MSINYKEIKQLPELTSFKPNDKIMMSRENDASTGYVVYSTLYSTMSAALSNELTGMEFDVRTVSELSNCTAADTRITTGRVASQLDSKCSSISAIAVGANASIKSLSASTAASISSVSTDIVNNYVDQLRFSPTSYILTSVEYVLTSNAKAQDISAYYMQDGSTIEISVAAMADKPIVHIIQNDCNALVQVKSSYHPTLFINPLLSSYALKQDIANNCNNASISSGYICLGEFKGATDVISVPCKKGTALCIYKNNKVESHLNVVPVLTSDFASNEIVLVKEIASKM